MTLDDDIKRHGNRYGFLVNLARAALDVGLKHMPFAGPYLHNRGEDGGPEFDESCVRCNLVKAIEHVELEQWDDPKRG